MICLLRTPVLYAASSHSHMPGRVVYQGRLRRAGPQASSHGVEGYAVAAGHGAACARSTRTKRNQRLAGVFVPGETRIN
jgi:hypothetical protein